MNINFMFGFCFKGKSMICMYYIMYLKMWEFSARCTGVELTTFLSREIIRTCSESTEQKMYKFYVYANDEFVELKVA